MKTLIDYAWQKFFEKELNSFSKLPLGFKNESYLCEGENGKFVLKFYAKNFRSDQFIEDQCGIVEELRLKGIPSLEYQKGIDGKYLQHIINGNKESYQVTTSKYVEAVEIEKPVISKALIHEVTDFLPKLHKALRNISSKETTIRTIDFESTLTELLSTHAINELERYLKNCDYWSTKNKQFIEKYRHQGEKILTHCQKNHRAKDQYQLIHGDFCLGNLDIRNNKITTIFDFDEMVIAPRSFEIACAIVHLDENYLYPEDLFVNTIKNYIKHEALNKSEQEDIIWLMLYRCFYRIGRYFTYYQDKAPEPFVQYTRKMRDYESLFDVL